MPQYNGQSASVTFLGTLAIASSTDTTPVTVTTTPAHGLVVNDLVSIAGHQTNYVINGTHVVLSTPTANTFTIGVSGIGVGGPTGTIQGIGLGNFSVPSDGDPLVASSVGVGFETLADESAFTALQQGSYKLVETIYAAPTSHFNSGWTTAGFTGVPAASWTIDAVNAGYLQFAHNLQGADLIEMTICGSAQSSVGGNSIAAILYASASWGNTPSYAPFFPAVQTSPTAPLTSGYLPFRLAAIVPIGSLGEPGFTFEFTLGVYSTLTCNIEFWGDLYLSGRLWRATQIPQ